MSEHVCISLAPLEGITGFTFRNVFAASFTGTDRCYTPFLSPGPGKGFSKRELRELLPENNPAGRTVPQLLLNNADYFLNAAREIAAYGYREVNLNLGCPSGTVTAKKKGAGFLSEPERLEAFLAEIYAKTEIAVSVKTRVGVRSPEEFPELLRIYNRFPVRELIIHPRVLKDYYNKPLHPECFELAVRESTNPLCYNGDIRTVADYRRIRESYPGVRSIMIGRGLIADPCLAEEIRRDENGDGPLPRRDRIEKISSFHRALIAEYRKNFPEQNVVLCRMKEIWAYLIDSFPEGRAEWKQLMKAKSLSAFEVISGSIFSAACGHPES